MSYIQTHSSNAVTIRGLAENLLTMRWSDMVAFCNGINGTRHIKMTPDIIHDWAANEVEACERIDEIAREEKLAKEAKVRAEATKENAAIMKGGKK